MVMRALGVVMCVLRCGDVCDIVPAGHKVSRNPLIPSAMHTGLCVVLGLARPARLWPLSSLVACCLIPSLWCLPPPPPPLLHTHAVCKATIAYPTLSLALSVALAQLLTQHPWPSAAAAAAAWRSGALLVFGWSLGSHVLEVVFTERVAMADDSDPLPTPPLLAALQHKDPIVQVSAGVWGVESRHFVQDSIGIQS